MEQWRGLTWDDSCMTVHTGAGGKPQHPPVHPSQAHLQQGTMAEGNLSKTGGKDTSRKPKHDSSSIPLFLLALVMFILPDPDASQKCVTTSETNSNSGYFLYLFKQCQCWIYFPQKDSRLSRTGWFLHQRTKNRFGPSQTTQITSKSRGEPHPGLAILPSLKNWLATKFHWLAAQEPGRVFQRLLFHSRATAYLSLIH